MNGADWRQYFFYGNFEKKIQNTKNLTPIFLLVINILSRKLVIPV